MKPLQLRLPGGEITQNISKVVHLPSVVDKTDTILSDTHLSIGSVVTLPVPVESYFGLFNEVFIPPGSLKEVGDFVIVDDISVKANNLVRVCEQVASGQKTIKALRSSFAKFQILLMSKVGTKDGILNSCIVGTRAKKSMRAVIVPSSRFHPAWVTIPESAMRAMELNDGDLVLCGRDPVIWGGSIEVLKACGSYTSCIELHPLLFKQFAADSDGDTVWIVAIPRDIDCQEEARAHLAEFCRKNARYAKNLMLDSNLDNVDWDNIENEIQYRFRTTGFSVGPEDILKASEDLTRLECFTKKSLKKECQAIAQGISDSEYDDYLLTMNFAMLVQKTYLGPMGAACNKIRLLASGPVASEYKEVLESCDYLSERAQQALFDFKGVIHTDSNVLNLFQILQILNKDGAYSTRSHFAICNLMVKSGFDRDKIWPGITFLYGILPMLLALANKPKPENWSLHYPYRLLGARSPEAACAVINEIAYLLKMKPEKISTDLALCRATRQSMTKELADPIYTIVNPFSLDCFVEAFGELKDRLNRSLISKLFWEVLDVHRKGSETIPCSVRVPGEGSPDLSAK